VSGCRGWHPYAAAAASQGGETVPPPIQSPGGCRLFPRVRDRRQSCFHHSRGLPAIAACMLRASAFMLWHWPKGESTPPL
jgi:hypothetical protein